MLILQAETLNRAPIVHSFFGRRGGVSKGMYQSLNCGPGSGDSRPAVMENRKRAIEALSPGSQLVTLYQVHSAEVVTVLAPWEITANPRADALVTDRPGILLGILTADCAPVLLCDSVARVVGAAHAGWQGALVGVMDAVVSAMEHLGAKASRITAAVGPCIARPSYEVGPEFQARFADADVANSEFFSRSAATGRWHFDLPAYVAHRLARLHGDRPGRGG